MAGTVHWDGLADFREMLRNMPTHLRDQAKGIVDHHAQITYSQTTVAYPLGGTGNLRKGLVVVDTESDAGVMYEVISKSSHAHLWEFGTVNRKTDDGWNRGRVRPAVDQGRQGLAPIAARNRIKMNRALIEMVRGEGFEVSGSLSGV